ncbi:hypothetical protein [Micromonospora siamensis]|uniref:Uncharacterized protein n=1 Tax=Micromonospora siamensis TaxID=299152 RepID=A0A1C5HD47_9ACTN|nr:hypothetical protein [Micromonospora siamensis]SCG43952.1 hypothetical protein GA0074704_1502 [Micromonospora siamensis]
MKTFRTAAPALLLCAALSACGGQGTGTPPPASSGGTPVTASPTPSEPVGPTASPSPTVVPPTGVPPTVRPPKKPGGPTLPPGPGGQTLTGTIDSGVEPNCLLLDGYLLVGGPRDVLKPGAKVTVTGQPQPDMMTTCQQGTPFVVEAARPA